MFKRMLAPFLLALSMLVLAVPIAGCGNMTGLVQTCTGANCTRADAYSTIAEMRDQTALLVSAGKITSTQADNVRTQLRTAQTAVDSSTSVTAGDDQFTKARAILAGLRTTLVAYGATLKP